jgi:hypothetical protein
MLYFYQAISSVFVLQFACRTSLWGVLCLNVLGTISLPLSYNAASVVSNLHRLDLEFVNTRNAQETETNIERRESHQEDHPHRELIHFDLIRNKDDDDDSNLSSLKILGFGALGLCNCNFATAEENGSAFFFLPSSGIIVKLTMIARTIPI